MDVQVAIVGSADKIAIARHFDQGELTNQRGDMLC
jgi:hypothetical protein